jgi:phosphoenolpyruvate carboxylase
MRTQSRKAIGYLLEQLHQLGAELSTTTSLIEVPDVELQCASPSNRPTAVRTRLDEPYRRAIAGFYARLAATALALDGLEAPRHAVGAAAPYARRRRVRRRPRCAAPLADQPQVRPARHAAACAACAMPSRIFGFHLAPLDLRQNSDVHARTWPNCWRWRCPAPTTWRWTKAARIALLLDELATPRPLTAPGVDYSDETRGELAIFHAAKSIHARYGKAAIENVHHLQDRRRFRHPRSGGAAQGRRAAAAVWNMPWT